MRLSPQETKALVSSFSAILKEISFKLYLFVSRLDPNKKGGDIDLLLIVDKTKKDNAIQLKNQIRIHIFSFIPEQRIDITVATLSELNSDPFLSEVIKSAQLLREMGSLISS